MEFTNNYRFKLKEWLTTYNAENKRLIINKIVKESGQSRHTVRRIMYMKKGDESYIRRETIETICSILDKDTTEFEYPTNKK
ncbi:MAG: hypothetical protein JST82_13920 [Bacteroidetes bacterium]|nr:hypothetical protein [Bacteroidota bacterium]